MKIVATIVCTPPQVTAMLFSKPCKLSRRLRLRVLHLFPTVNIINLPTLNSKQDPIRSPLAANKP